MCALPVTKAYYNSYFFLLIEREILLELAFIIDFINEITLLFLIDNMYSKMSKKVLSDHSKRRPKNGFQDRL